MARDEDDDDGLPPLGENTDKFLDQAKKGQARNFLLVCKGNKVKYLAVRKKPVKKNELNEAKKAGYKGDGYFGVITGKGMDLVFNLSTADGYTSEPVKDKILKDFLEEKADFKCKPTIAIVAVLPAVPFDDEDLKNPLVARFLALDVKISEVLDLNPNAESELSKTTAEIRLLLQDGEFDVAEPKIVAFEARLQALLGGAPADLGGANPEIQVPASPSTAQPASPVLESTTPPVDNETLKQKLQEALNKLVPQLKQAVVTYPDKKVELLTPVAQIKKQMDSGELQEAKKGIVAVGQLLKSVMAQGTTSGTSESPTQTEDPLKAEFERKLAALKPNYDKCLQNMLGDTSKFRTVMAYATEQAEAGVYGNAIKAIDRLVLALDQAIASGSKETDVIRKGIVAEQSAKLEEYFRNRVSVAQDQTASEVAKIEQGLQDVPDEDPADLANEILAALNSTYDNAREELVALVRRGDKDAILEGVRSWRANIGKDPLILHIETCGTEIGVAAQVLESFKSLFNDIEAEVQKTDVVTA